MGCRIEPGDDGSRAVGPRSTRSRRGAGDGGVSPRGTEADAAMGARARPAVRPRGAAIVSAPASRAENLRGAAFMTASMAAFTLNDALTKSLAGEVPLFQLSFLRGLIVCAILVPVAWARGSFRARPSRHDAGWLALRTAAEIGAAYLFISALFNMPLANATAILQALPLAVTAAGALLLGERVGRARWAAVGAGLVGVLLMIRPDAQGFDRWSLYALGTVGMVTLREVATRRLSAAVPSLAVAASAAVGVTLFAGAMTAGQGASPPGPGEWARIAGAALCMMGAYLCSVGAMRSGDMSFSAPFRYTGLVWALILGLAVFGEWPGAFTLVGAGIVVAAGLVSLRAPRRMATARRGSQAR